MLPDRPQWASLTQHTHITGQQPGQRRVIPWAAYLPGPVQELGQILMHPGGLDGEDLVLAHACRDEWVLGRQSLDFVALTDREDHTTEVAGARLPRQQEPPGGMTARSRKET